MSGLRFKVGDLAWYMVARARSGFPYMGTIVQIESVGPFARGQLWKGSKFKWNSDYIVMTHDDALGEVSDFQLRKIDPPAEPASLTRETDVEVEA